MVGGAAPNFSGNLQVCLCAPPLFGSCASLGGRATAAENKSQSVCLALFSSLRLAFVRLLKCLFPRASDVARDEPQSVIKGILPALKISIAADYKQSLISHKSEIKNTGHKQLLNK